MWLVLNKFHGFCTLSPLIKSRLKWSAPLLCFIMQSKQYIMLHCAKKKLLMIPNKKTMVEAMDINRVVSNWSFSTKWLASVQQISSQHKVKPHPSWTHVNVVFLAAIWKRFAISFFRDFFSFTSQSTL